MRVVHLVAGNLFGGVESLSVTLARYRELAPDMEPHFALFFPGRLSHELEQLGARVSLLGSVRLSRPWSVWRARRRFVKLLSKERPDVVLSHGVWPVVVVGRAVHRSGVPLALFQHTAAHPNDWFERWASRVRVDGLVANSAFTARTLEPLYPDHSPLVYRCPVPAPVPVSDAERAELRRELGVSPDQALIIQASRIEPGKGHRGHLRALGDLKERRDWVCLQVGGPQRPEEALYYEELKQLVAALGISDRVKFLGERRDVPRLLAASDIYCQPSEAPEGFGLSFIEAMLTGLPVVSTGIGAVTEFITADTGALVSDHTELVTALDRLLESPAERHRLGENGRLVATRLCGPEHQLPELASLLTQMTGNFTSTRQRQ